MTTMLFCDECGAALLTQADPCPVCGQMPSAPSVQQALPPTDLLSPGFLLAQRYRIEEKIGEGGFGLVYRARDRKNGQQVAIKQITLAALSAQEMIEATDSYNREITILPRLKHVGLPAIYDHFTDPGHWYIVMNYIDGQTLEEKLARAPGGRLPVWEVLHIGQKLCEVLGYLHVQEPPVIFRDVKPANVMISKLGSVYLIDFGIARRYRTGQSKDTRPLGSPGYAAPEQYGKEQSTTLTDIYGLGATLQTLLTGKEPWEIEKDGIPADCTIPIELQRLLTSTMQRDPEQRPAFMHTVALTLQSLQSRYPRPSVQVRSRLFQINTPAYPLAWLVTLWNLFMYVVGIIFFPSLSRIVLSACLVIPLCIIAGVTTHLFLKKRRAMSGKLTRKDLRTVLKDGLAGSLYWVSQFSIWICIYPSRYAFESGNFHAIVAFAFYDVVFVAGAIVIMACGRAKQKKVAAQGQQPVQKQLIKQKIRERR